MPNWISARMTPRRPLQQLVAGPSNRHTTTCLRSLRIDVRRGEPSLVRAAMSSHQLLRLASRAPIRRPGSARHTSSASPACAWEISTAPKGPWAAFSRNSCPTASHLGHRLTRPDARWPGRLGRGRACPFATPAAEKGRRRPRRRGRHRRKPCEALLGAGQARTSDRCCARRPEDSGRRRLTALTHAPPDLRNDGQCCCPPSHGSNRGGGLGAQVAHECGGQCSPLPSGLRRSGSLSRRRTSQRQRQCATLARGSAP